MRQRNALIDRIVQMRRGGAVTEQPPMTGVPPSPPGDLAALEARIAHLEQLVEGLQDSVHRELTRQQKQFAELESRIEPAALAVALSEDARQRGL